MAENTLATEIVFGQPLSLSRDGNNWPGQPDVAAIAELSPADMTQLHRTVQACQKAGIHKGQIFEGLEAAWGMSLYTQSISLRGSEHFRTAQVLYGPHFLACVEEIQVPGLAIVGQSLVSTQETFQPVRLASRVLKVLRLAGSAKMLPPSTPKLVA